MREKLRELWIELKARSAGRRAMGHDPSLFRSARGIVGAPGNSFSGAWEYLERDGGAYLKSMETDPVLPPSLFVSDRDRTRLGQPMPIAERCIEDHGVDDALPVRDWDMAELSDDMLRQSDAASERADDV